MPLNPLIALLGSTRGEILQLLRRHSSTVDQLAKELHLTDNAIRAHLAALQEAGLIAQAGFQPGFRKPHALFELTPAARDYFSRLYIPVLTTLLDSVQQKIPSEKMDALVRDIGRRLAADHKAAITGLSFDQRLDYAAKLLAEFGALADIERRQDHLAIRGHGCPLATAVSSHPQVCALLETLLHELLGRDVHEQCTKGPNPCCCFHIN